MQGNMRRWVWIGVGLLGAWLGAKYLLPLLFPFGLGLGLALAAEPAVKAGTRYLKLPRWAAAGVGVSLTLVLMTVLFGILGAAIVRELGVLAGKLPALEDTARQSVDTLRGFLEDAAAHAPEGVRPLVDRSVDRLFSSPEVMMEQVSGRVPGVITGFLGKIPKGFLTVGTGILSGFLISIRLPRLKKALKERLPEKVRTNILPALKRTKAALLAWMKAQAKLMGITFAILLTGFLLLRIPLGFVWAAVVAVVDAVPILGTGTILLPWALVCLIQGKQMLAIGLLVIYGCTFVTRTALEPKLIGRSLNMDPLLTLVFLYVGFRFWGFLGLVFTPILASALLSAVRIEKAPQ